MAQKFLELFNGKLKQKEAVTSSTGVAQAGQVIAANSLGKLDVSLLPAGVGPDIKVLECTEAIAAGSYVNIYDSGGGVEKVRLADAGNSRSAHGFVLTNFTLGANAEVYFEGPNSALSSLTVGARYYLDTAGNVTATPVSAPAYQIHQLVGVAIDSNTINTDIDDEIVLA